MVNGEAVPTPEPMRPVQPLRTTVAIPVDERHHVLSRARERDVVGNTVPEIMTAAEKDWRNFGQRSARDEFSNESQKS